MQIQKFVGGERFQPAGGVEPASAARRLGRVAREASVTEGARQHLAAGGEHGSAPATETIGQAAFWPPDDHRAVDARSRIKA